MNCLFNNNNVYPINSTLIFSKNYSKSTNNSIQDIESQMSEIYETKTCIRRMYSRSCCNRKHGMNSFGNLSVPQRIKFYKQKKIVYNFLQRPRGLWSVLYHIFICCVVLICLILNVLSTVEEHQITASDGLECLDVLIVILFGLEFIARFWSSSCLAQYRNCNGKIRFLCNPFRIFDIFAITTSAIVLFFDFEGHILSTFIKGFRLFQVFGMFRLEHRFSPWKLMGSVVWNQREHLCITAYLGFLSLLIVSFIVYFAEKDVNPDFRSIADSMWWSVVTLCTVGYGEITPITAMGKFLSCICIILGVSLFALPAGILGTGLALKVEEQQHKRQIGKLRQPAAKLIQNSWRFHLVTMSSLSWKRYLMTNTKFDYLTNRQKNALRFIIVVKFLVTKRRFNSSFKPYDIKDVLEQYAAGHADVLAGMRQLQNKIRAVQSVVDSNSKSLQEFKVIMTSHIFQTQNSVTNRDLRFNKQIKDNHSIDRDNSNNSNSKLFKLSSFRRRSY